MIMKNHLNISPILFPLILFFIFGISIFFTKPSEAKIQPRGLTCRSQKLVCLKASFVVKHTPGHHLKKWRVNLLNKYKECLAVANIVEKIIEPAQPNGSNFLLYLNQNELLSREITASFNPTALQESQNQALVQYGKVLEVKLEPTVSVTDDWMESTMLIVTEKSNQRYLVVFHREENNWKLFGTQVL
jgi:hypothetical protein